MAEDLAAFGFAPAEVDRARADLVQVAVPDAPFEVFPENVTAVKLFLALRTQWRVTALATMSQARLVQTGLDYGVVRPVAELEGLELAIPDDFHRLRAMEAEAIAAFGEEAR